MDVKTSTEDETITRVVVRMNATMFGLILGLLFGVGLFLATIWLILKGGPNQGAHLGLLSQYFPGYDVTLLGSLFGFVYAFVIGFASGIILGLVYNRLAR